MPGPLKNNPANTTGLILTKAGGARSRTPSALPTQTPRTGDQALDKYITDLKAMVENLQLKVEQHEQKLNRMRVDPVTKVVTFIA